MSPMLRRILTEWLEWATNGADHHHRIFSRDTGLCDTVAEWSDRSGYTAEVSNEFEALLIRDFGYDPYYLQQGRKIVPSYPFGGFDRWDRDYCGDTMHTNELRLDWVRKVLAE